MRIFFPFKRSPLFLLIETKLQSSHNKLEKQKRSNQQVQPKHQARFGYCDYNWLINCQHENENQKLREAFQSIEKANTNHPRRDLNWALRLFKHLLPLKPNKDYSAEEHSGWVWWAWRGAEGMTTFLNQATKKQLELVFLTCMSSVGGTTSW